MAQLVERILGKDEVPGSNPGSSSKLKPFLMGRLFGLYRLSFRKKLKGAQKSSRNGFFGLYRPSFRKKLKGAQKSSRNGFSLELLLSLSSRFSQRIALHSP